MRIFLLGTLVSGDRVEWEQLVSPTRTIVNPKHNSWLHLFAVRALPFDNLG